MELDEEEETKTKIQEIELMAWYANPEFYYAVQKHRKGLVNTNSEPFKVVQDTTPFNDRMAKASKGEVETNPQREDIAQRVKAKRLEMEQQKQHSTPDELVNSEELDTLDIEGVPPARGK